MPLLYPLVWRGIDRYLDVTPHTAARVGGQLSGRASTRWPRCSTTAVPSSAARRFTAADLTFSALAASVLMPPQYGVPLPQPDELPAQPPRMVRELRAHPAGRTRDADVPRAAALIRIGSLVAHAGQEIEGPDGFRLLLVRTGRRPAASCSRWRPATPAPGTCHRTTCIPKQVERFEVLEGSVRTMIGGVERDYGSGESFEVPAGTPHQMTADVPARVRWQVAPALRTAEFFERLYAALAGQEARTRGSTCSRSTATSSGSSPGASGGNRIRMAG